MKNNTINNNNSTVKKSVTKGIAAAAIVIMACMGIWKLNTPAPERTRITNSLVYTVETPDWLSHSEVL